MNEQAKLVSLLFYSSEPISHKLLCKNFGIDSEKLQSLILSTNKQLETLCLVIVDNEREAILATQAGYANLIEEFYETSPQPLSQAALEVLSIVAYKQPITRASIDEIRGVGSEQSIKNLLNKQLIKKTNANNETNYRTTTEFLNAMGITNIKQLPRPNDGITQN